MGGIAALSNELFGSSPKDVAEVQASAADRATDSQMQMYRDYVSRMAPWTEEGTKALRTLAGRVNAGPGEFNPEEQPGYQFGYKELVEKPLLANASATGKLRSGQVLKALSDRAQGYASMSYDNWLNRWLTKMQPLQSLAGVGQTAVSATGSAGTQTGIGVANSQMAAGNAMGAGLMNQANQITGMSKAGTSSYLDYQMMQKLGGGNLFDNAGMSGGSGSYSNAGGPYYTTSDLGLTYGG